MNKKTKKINFDNFKLLPAQISSGIRIVPIINDNFTKDLRLCVENYNSFAKVENSDNTIYSAYIPHGFILNYDKDNNISYTKETVILNSLSEKNINKYTNTMIIDKMVKKQDKDKIRFLPLHLAMDSFMSEYFKGFDIKWEEYSRKGTKFGLSPRSEKSIFSNQVIGLENALRVFELHKNQVGVILFVGDSLASVFIVPNPYDYKYLHYSLIKDFYGEIIYFNSLYVNQVKPFEVKFNEKNINKISDFKIELDRIKKELGSFYSEMSNNIIKREVSYKKIYKFKKYSMEYFVTNEIEKYDEHYIGEAIFDENENINYMKLFRLSNEQVKRFSLLKLLDDNLWNLEQTAKSKNTTKENIILQIDKLGFAHILQPKFIEQAKKQLKQNIT